MCKRYRSRVEIIAFILEASKRPKGTAHRNSFQGLSESYSVQAISTVIASKWIDGIFFKRKDLQDNG